MKITGKFLEYDVKNRNDRIYTKECAEQIVKQFNELNEPMLGIMDIPEDPNNVPPTSVSHVVKDIYVNEEEKCIEGTFETLGTWKGKILSEVIDAFGGQEKFNEHFFMASRGTGTVNENKEVENFTIHSFDVCARSANDTVFKLK
jgi:hypothetical protein